MRAHFSKVFLFVILITLPGLSACAGNQPPVTALGPGPPTDFLIAAIGDSIASGQGAPNKTGSYWHWHLHWHWPWSPEWDDKRCNRSIHAGTTRAVERLRADNSGKTIHYISFACSGASIAKGLVGPYQGAEGPLFSPDREPLEAQIKAVGEWANGRQIDVLTISVGGNDVFFAPLAAACLFPVLECTLARGVIAHELTSLQAFYDQIRDKIKEWIVPFPRYVFLTEYANPTRDEQGAFCNESPAYPQPEGGITVTEAKWISEKVIGVLNATIEQKALEYTKPDEEWIYIGEIAEAFNTHGWCAGDQRWINTIKDSAKRQRHWRGGFHPNVEGHKVYSDRLYQEIKDRL